MSPAGTASRSSSRGKRPSALLLHGPLPVEQIRDEDDRELQALRLVQGHQPHALDVLGQLDARRQLAAGGLVGIEVGDEPGQRPVRVGGLPVRGEAQEAGDVRDGPLRLERVGGDQVEDLAGPLEVALEDGVRALAEGQRVELVERTEELAQLCAGAGRGVHLGGLRLFVPVRDPVHLDAPGLDDRLGGLEQVRAVELRHPGHPEDLERIEPPRPGGHHPDERDVVVRVRDRPQRLFQVADLGRVEQAQPTDDGVRDVLVAQPRHDRLAVLVLAVQDGDIGPAWFRAGPLPHHRLDGVDDGDGLVLRAGADEELDGVAVGAVRAQALVGLEASLVVRDQPVRDGQDVPDGAEVLLDPKTRRRARWSGVWVVHWRPGEPALELGERRETGAPEAIDRLVVVADDHDIVRAIRRPPKQLDELDLGDVGVLELVDQDVAELALPASQDVRARLEQLRDGGDLLTEVERAAARELLLVGSIDGGELGQAEDLEGGAIDDVGGGELVDLRVVLSVEAASALGAAGAGERPSGLAVGGLVGGVGVVVGGLAAGLGAFVGADPGVGALDLAQRHEVALGLEARRRCLEAAVSSLEDAALLVHEGIEVVRADQLVLRPVDELDEVRPAPPVRAVW